MTMTMTMAMANVNTPPTMRKQTFTFPNNHAVPHTPNRSTSSSSSWSIKSLASSESIDSTTFWRTPPKRWETSSWAWVTLLAHLSRPTMIRQSLSRLQATLLVIISVLAFFLLAPLGGQSKTAIQNMHSLSTFQHIGPALQSTEQRRHDPLQWLAKNSGDKHAISRGFPSQILELGDHGRPRAALISLVRNSELQGIIQSMRQMEYRWNTKYQYPWIFFNDEPFTEEFKAATRNLTVANCYYEIIPKEHWSLPDWINENRFMTGLEFLGTIGVGKGWMISYHHMCRWNSGFFYKHPSLRDYDWYWRVEPDVHYFCDIDYDVFRFMRDNDLKYGFNMNILDDARSFPSLWASTRAFAAAYPHLVHPKADLDWLLDSETEGEYNNCQFFSNFEIGSLNFWRGEANEAYFNWLDRAGGFYYERFGDAPVHTLSIAMFAPKSEIWFFRDIGYQHDINRHCPPHREGRCSCEPTRMDENFYKLVPLESPQKKPEDTCIRQFLGGDWLVKKEGWTAKAEREFGGDGYHGYEVNE